jgi:hypothetical protein
MQEALSYGGGNIDSMARCELQLPGPNSEFSQKPTSLREESEAFAQSNLHRKSDNSAAPTATFKYTSRCSFREQRDIPAKGSRNEQFNMAAFGTAFNVGVGSAVTASLTNAEVDALNPAHVSALNAALKEETAALKKFIAAEDADAVYKATHGLGTDEARLVRAA